MESSTPFFPPCKYNISEGKGRDLELVHINYNEFRPCASHYVVGMTIPCINNTTTEVDDDRSFEGRCVVDFIKDGEVLRVGD